MIYWFFRVGLFACIISCDGGASRKRDSIDFYRYLAVELSPLPLPFSLCLSLFHVRSLWLPPSFPFLPFSPFLLVPPAVPLTFPSVSRVLTLSFLSSHPPQAAPFAYPEGERILGAGIENLNTYDPEGRFYAKCALGNDEKTRFLLSHERGFVTKNHLLEFPALRNTCKINSS